ncbi:sugar transporter [Streptomyces canarius]
MKRKLAAAIVIAGMMVSVSACGGDDGDDSGKNAGPDSFKGQTLTVWAMDGSTPDQWVKDVTAAFEKKTGAKLKFETQKWDGIQQKITTALSESTPPDVLEVGNTQTPAYAATGGLADLSDLKKEIGADWTPSVSQSSVYDGKQYAAPWYFANRVVIYNKKIWAKAGIKDTPKTRDEFFKDLETIGKKTDAEPIYLPGQNWYFFDGLTIGQGADLVKKDGGKYVSNLGDPKVAKAMEIYKKYASYSKAPKDKDEATPQQAEVFAKGKTGAFIGMGWEAGYGRHRQQGHREGPRLLHHPR